MDTVEMQSSKIKMQNYNSKFKIQNSKFRNGFTLIELLISMALIAVLTGAAIKVARFSDTHKNLTLSANEISAVLRSAQSSALSIPNPLDRHVCGFGVYFGDHGVAGVNARYEMFYTYVADNVFTASPKTCDENANYRGGTLTNYQLVPDGGKHALPAGVTLDAGIVDKTIFFKVPYGEVYNNDGTLQTMDRTITIKVGTNTKDIVVTPSGQVE